uniref:Anti-proliferative protein domain-containing protein n=1 Tax=Periophthalmus magnuspinnatus TaxID=409849 RepID=A0A3B4BI98_9GOBI
MIREVKAGVNFLKRLVVARGKLEETKAELFAEKLQQHLCSRYDDHWYPESPSKGQAFCIRINNGVLSDEAVLKACAESELKPSDLGLPRELTLWIDPLEVCASGENSRPFTVATFTQEEQKEESLKSAQEDSLSEESINLDTSDYHSATSSDCGSTASSDTEEESKDQEEEEVPPSLQYYYQPTQVWSPYKKAPPMFLTTVCAPPPPPPQPLVGYYILPQPSPQFILPQASLQPWGAVKG